MAKILVLGFTGGIGRAATKALVENGHNVTALVRSRSKGEKYINELTNITLIEGDASDYNSVLKAADGCSHLVYGLNIPYDKWSENVVPLLETSLKVAAAKKLKFIFPGNVYVYGPAKLNPVNEAHPHEAPTKKGKIRVEMENLIKKYSTENNFPYTIIRMPDFYGPYVVNGFSEKLFINSITGKSLQWIGNKETTTEYIFIEDGGKAIANAAISEKADNQEFNIPASEPITNGDFLRKIAIAGGKNVKFSTLNSDIVFNIMGVFNPMVKEVKEMLYLKREKLVLDGTKYKKTFGNIPATPYREGIDKTISWAKEFFKL